MTAKALQDSGFPTALTDSQATALGLKVYTNGVAYNGGNTPATTGTNWTTARGKYIPYQMQDGTWRLRLNITGVYSGASSSNVANPLTISGITTIVEIQALAVNDQGCQARAAACSASVLASSGTIQLLFGASTNYNTFQFIYSGDIELASKPTWAY